MTEHAPGRIWSTIDVPKTIAGVLAALSAAVIGSFLGVAGTLAGAAVASLIGSVGTEVYHRSLKKGTDKLQGAFTTAPAAVGTPPVPAAVSSASATTVTLPAMPSGPSRGIRWSRVAMVAGALFVLAIGVLTAAELISGRSIADATRGGSADRSTVSSIFSDKSGKSGKSTPAPSPSSSPEGTSPTTTPTTTPTTEPTTQPTSEAPATQAPTTQAPTTAAPTGDTGDTGSGSGTVQRDSGAGGADTQNPDDGTE